MSMAQKHQGCINLLTKKFYNKAKDDESVDKVAAELKKKFNFSIREIKKAEAATNLAVAISRMSAVDEETYHMAIFHLERESNLRLELALESVKSVEQSSTDKEEAEQLYIAQRAYDKDNKSQKVFPLSEDGPYQDLVLTTASPDLTIRYFRRKSLRSRFKNIRIPNDRYRADCEAKGYCEFVIIQVRRWVEAYLRYLDVCDGVTV